MATFLVYPANSSWGTIFVEADDWVIDEPYNTIDFHDDDGTIVASFFLHCIIGFVRK